MAWLLAWILSVAVQGVPTPPPAEPAPAPPPAQAVPTPPAPSPEAKAPAPAPRPSDDGVRFLGIKTGLPWWAVLPTFVLVLWPGLTYLFYRFLKTRVHFWILTLGVKVYDTIFRALLPSLVGLFILLGLKILFDSDFFPDRLQKYTDFTLVTAVAILITFSAIRVATELFMDFARRHEHVLVASTPVLWILRLLIVMVGVLTWMEAIGIPVTPLIVVLAVGGFATGLALSATLSNFFAGLYLVYEHPIRVGDRVRVEGTGEGTVSVIGWHSTRVVARDGVAWVVPNRRITDGIVTTVYRAGQPIVTSVDVTVPFGQDPERVEGLLRRAVEDQKPSMKGLAPDSIPEVRFEPGITPRGLGFRVVMIFREADDADAAKHALQKTILRRFSEASVPMV